MTSSSQMLLWVGVPYLVIAIFVTGHVWRYRTGQYTWTTRSSQLLESRQLKWGIILFHVGILAVVGGHVGGLLIPKSWTEAVGITEHMYHLVAVIMGTLAGVMVTVGLALLMVRRATNKRVRAVTVTRDVITLLALAIVIITGMANTIGVQILGEAHDYRESVSPWIRSIFLLQPKPDLMTAAPISFKVHALAALTLFALWPFTRLVHAWSVPLTFLARPFIVFRRRDSVLR